MSVWKQNETGRDPPETPINQQRPRLVPGSVGAPELARKSTSSDNLLLPYVKQTCILSLGMLSEDVERRDLSAVLSSLPPCPVRSTVYTLPKWDDKRGPGVR